jgi:hypothetical protein
MRRVLIAMTLGAVVLALSGSCKGGKQTEQSYEEPTLPPVLCDPKMQGTVGLTITGKPGDSFRINFRCDADVVIDCTATIPDGANTATCKGGPVQVPKGGVRTCRVGPGNKNSKEAKVQRALCE